MKTPFDRPSRGHVPVDPDTLDELATGSDKVAARPIRINREHVDDLTRRIVDAMKREGEGREQEPVGVREAILDDVFIGITVDGEPKTVIVVVKSGRGSVNPFVSGGGFGRVTGGPYKGAPIILVELDGRSPWDVFGRYEIVGKHLNKILMHEITHAMDRIRRDKPVMSRGGVIPTSNEVDLDAYFNDPREVRAYMRHIYEEIRPLVLGAMGREERRRDWGLGGAVQKFLRVNRTWNWMDPYLTRENRNRILKGIVTAFEDELPDVPLAPARVASAWLRTAASRPKYQGKKEVTKADGSGTTTVYQYGPRQVANRHKEKADRIEGLSGRIGDLRRRVKSDLKSDDPETRLTALAVALIDATYERVGNDESADNGHYGVTGWTMDHIKFSKNGKRVTFQYTGKSGVDHKKTVDDPDIIRALNLCCGDKSNSDHVLSDGDVRATSKMVNDYLRDFDITAKDLRGYHANREMQERLRAIRSKGPKLPRPRKERDAILKDEFAEALEGAAEAVGHETATLRKQYLVPWLEDSYMKDGTVIDRLDKTASVLSGWTFTATKTDAEREDAEAERLVRRTPKVKPSRDDSKRERMQVQDPDTTDSRDKDLSLNYKDNG